MKSNYPKWVEGSPMRLFFTLTLALFVATSAWASHFRFGSINWQQVSGNTVQIKVVQGWRTSAFFYTPPTVGMTANYVDYLYFGDGQGTYVNLTVTAVNTAEDWFIGEMTVSHTYAGAGPYEAYYSSCCRIGSLQNNSNGSFRGSTTIKPGTSNSSPVTSVPAMIALQTGLANASFQIPGTDPDGDPLTYSLASYQEVFGNNPAGFSVSASGMATFSTVGKPIGSLWSVAVKISDGQTYILADFIIKIVATSTPPQFNYTSTPANGTVIQTSPGAAVNFSVLAYDTDPGSTVALSVVGAPISAGFSPTLPVSGNPVGSAFSWTPTSSNLGTTVMNFIATDNVGVQTSTSVSIVVSLKPQFDVPPTPDAAMHLVVATNQQVSYTVQASDPDPADVVQITAAANMPAGASLSTALPSPAGNPTSTAFSWTPGPADWGHHHVVYTATDSYGDTKTHEVSLVVNDPPVFASTAPSQVNIGQTYQYNVVATDANLPYGDHVELHVVGTLPSWMSFLDNGDGTGTLSGSPALSDVGTYSITIQAEDDNHHMNQGGIPYQTFTVEVIPCNLSLSATASDALCYGSATGSIDLTVNGANGAISYSWSNGSNSEDLAGVAAGTYSVSITDAFGCSESLTITVGEPNAPLSYSFSATPILCNGGLSTQDLVVYGGTAPYTVTNQGGGALVIGAQEGVHYGGPTYAANYDYTITDANGCTLTFNANITQPSALALAAASTSNYNGWEVSCNGASDGSAVASASGGTAPYSYVWSNGSTTSGANSLTAGTYNVVVTDANGCVASASVTLDEPTQLVVGTTMSPNHPVSPGGMPQTIYLGYGPQQVTLNASASGATQGYSYSWTPTTGLGSPNSSSTAAAPTVTTTYTVTVTDANGCVENSSITVQVVDARCGKNNNKVLVCHYPPGNPSNAQEICISASAVPSHLANHGDMVGPCNGSSKTLVEGSGMQMNLFPNPATDKIVVELELADNGVYQLQIIDMGGRTVLSQTIEEEAGHYHLDLDLAGLTNGVYILRVAGEQTQMQERLVVQ